MTDTKIKIEGLYKIFGRDPSSALEKVRAGVGKQELLEKHDHVLGLKDINLDIPARGISVIMGLSGSGKSTLVRCLSRLIDPTEGQVLIDGRDITTVSHSELKDLRRNKLAMVFQHFGLFPHRKVIDNVAYGLEVRGEGRKQRYEKAMEIIDLVGLEGWADHYPRELSGGMQQRVGLARAMAVEPEILLFDEPFSALDPLIRREMQDELLDLQSRLKKTMVFITHDFLEAIKMGDHIMIMRDGAISQMGTPEEIVANPADKYVADFTEDVPRYKVLSAGKVMRPASKPSVLMSAKIDGLIDIVADTDKPVAVVDSTGAVQGEIDRSIVMKSMKGSF